MFCYFKICKTASVVISASFHFKVTASTTYTLLEHTTIQLLYVKYWGKKDTVSPNDYLHSWAGGWSLIFKWKGF